MAEIQRIELEGLVNTRDLGGFETVDGKKIKPKRLIRSGELFNATASDIQKLTEEYHLKTVVDFRTGTERMGKPDPEIDGVMYVINPILREETMGITREKENEKKDGLEELMKFISRDDFDVVRYMEEIYERIVSDGYSMAQYKKFFDILLNQETGAVLWHCSAGKDRVGVGTALLLTALDVPREVIYEDYVKVNEYVKEKNEKMINGMLKGVGEPEREKLQKNLDGMFSVRKEYIQSVFQRIEEIYGSVAQCLEMAAGLDAEKRKKLKEMYLVD